MGAPRVAFFPVHAAMPQRRTAVRGRGQHMLLPEGLLDAGHGKGKQTAWVTRRRPERSPEWW
eukprot:2902630-Amphidinium_carterae.2